MRYLLLMSLLLAIGGAGAQDILAYVQADDDSYAWEPSDSGLPNVTNLSLTSQTWQGIEWHHTVSILRPQTVKIPDLTVLLITGGSYKPHDEMMLASMLANNLGVTFAILFDIPNQPLWDMREDDLIAHTFVKTLETGDRTWPLLFPMTKSAVRAMDAIQEYSEEHWDQKIERFITTGASKRGWTTWFTGVVDSRVAGIMPMVYDNLNLGAQMPHQLEVWGRYSPQIDDYTRRGLQEKLDSEQGRQLAGIVDPYTYRDRILVPKLLINGTNDAYWTIDALNLYRDDLKGETWQIYVPNSGHGLNDIQRVINSASGFVRLVGGNLDRPIFTWTHGRDEQRATLEILAPTAKSVSLWYATSDDGLFTDQEWKSQPMVQAQGGRWVGEQPLPAAGQMAVFGEAQFDVAGQVMPVSTTMQLLKVE